MTCAKRSFAAGRAAQRAALSREAATVGQMADYLAARGPAAIATEADMVRVLFGHFRHDDILHLGEDARLAAFRRLTRPQ